MIRPPMASRGAIPRIPAGSRELLRLSSRLTVDSTAGHCVNSSDRGLTPLVDIGCRANRVPILTLGKLNDMDAPSEHVDMPLEIAEFIDEPSAATASTQAEVLGTTSGTGAPRR